MNIRREIGTMENDRSKSKVTQKISGPIEDEIEPKDNRGGPSESA